MTEREIQNSLYRFCLRRGDKFFAPNFYLHWETDFVSVTRDFKVCAYEIKISRADFKADFQKHEKHKTFNEGKPIARLPNRFYYVCPAGLLNANEIPHYAGLLWVEPIRLGCRVPSRPTSVKKAPSLHSEPASRELTQRLCVSLMHRYWRMRIKRSKQTYG